MITSLLTSALALSTAPTYSPLKAVDASLFKNGYAMMTYEVKVPASGEVFIKEPPQATMGTVWFYTEKGGKISELVLTSVKEESVTKVTAQSLVALMALNKGKPAKLVIRDYDNNGYKTVNAKIIEANNGLVIYEANGTQTSVSPGNIQSVEISNTVYSSDAKTSVQTPVIKLRSTPNKSVFMYALQSGLTWSPAYNIDISDEKELILTAKATVINDLTELNLKESRLISGFPNIAFLGQPDPFLTYQRIQQFAGGGGGMGGGASLANRMDTQRAYMPSTALESFSESMNVNDLAGFQAEDLYFYQLPNVNLKQGDRGYYVIFQAKSEYKHVYTLDIPMGSRTDNRFIPVPPERTNVWHKLSFKNTSGRPLTTAPTMIMQNGQMIAQDTITYVPNGAEIKLPITQSLDIASTVTEEEESIERGATKDRNGNPVLDLVTVTGKISISNFKDKEINIELTKDVLGEFLQLSDNGSSSKSVRDQSDSNPTSTGKWSLKLAKGAKKEITYSYKVLVQSRGF